MFNCCFLFVFRYVFAPSLTLLTIDRSRVQIGAWTLNPLPISCPLLDICPVRQLECVLHTFKSGPWTNESWASEKSLTANRIEYYSAPAPVGGRGAWPPLNKIWPQGRGGEGMVALHFLAPALSIVCEIFCVYRWHLVTWRNMEWILSEC